MSGLQAELTISQQSLDELRALAVKEGWRSVDALVGELTQSYQSEQLKREAFRRDELPRLRLPVRRRMPQEGIRVQ